MAMDKLKTKLRLASHRLRVQQKKKIEQSTKAHKSVAELLSVGRYDHARIATEQIVRDDFTAEAMDLLEGYCDLLLSRFGLFESKKLPDENLIECVATLLWAAPKLVSSVTEFIDIAKLLRDKYGDKFCDDLCTDAAGVNQRVKVWLSEAPPPQAIIERYMEEIAKSFEVKYDATSAGVSPDDASTLFLWQRDAARAEAKAKMHASCDPNLSNLPDLPGAISVTGGVVDKHDLGAIEENEDQLAERLNRLRQS